MKEFIISVGIIIGSLIGYAFDKNAEITIGQITGATIFALISYFYNSLKR